MPISIVGGKLWQWDLNRKVEITGSVDSQVHFAHRDSNKDAVAVAVERLSDGRLVADIPNFMLQENATIDAYVWSDEHTQEYLLLKVNPRQRPSTYVYQPTAIVTFETLTKEVREQLDDFRKQLEHIDYANIENKPTIEGVVLDGDLLMEDFGADTVVTSMSDTDIDSLF